MKIILQRISGAEIGIEENLKFTGQGYVLFIREYENDSTNIILKAVEKILKIRLWEGWSKSLVDLRFSIIISPCLDNINEKDCTLSSKIFLNLLHSTFEKKYIPEKIFLCDKVTKLKFINDGPCTLILEF